jgi:hypothetical protein
MILHFHKTGKQKELYLLHMVLQSISKSGQMDQAQINSTPKNILQHGDENLLSFSLRKAL